MGGTTTLATHAVGIGLRHRHYQQALADDASLGPVGFLEVHSENFFAAGGATRAVLERARARWPVSLHGVGLGLGNAHGLAPRHLDQLARLVEWCEPALVSEHVCWTASMTPQGEIAHNDLLPLPYTHEALETLCTHIDRVQNRLKRRIAIENASAYVKFTADEMPELMFVAEAARRTGCGVLLDLNNLHVNATNFGFDAVEALHALPRGVVDEIHLAGHLDADGVLIDDHGSRVRDSVWTLYTHALRRFGPVPTLIEWDTDVPELAVLVDEASRAADLLSRAGEIAA
ncbi:MAG TPA: DUF692 domain-containing protein [Burkholderiaceae bacterium]|nr:DUF692 domain-containing protein [Burkholderiaceae bacterium]